MRVQSYGNSVFDVKREFQDSRRKTKKLIAYFILSGIVFFILRFVFELNSIVFLDIVDKTLHGESANVDYGYFLDQAKSNKIVAFMIGIYYFLEKSFFSFKEYLTVIFSKILNYSKKIID